MPNAKITPSLSFIVICVGSLPVNSKKLEIWYILLLLLPALFITK